MGDMIKLPDRSGELVAPEQVQAQMQQMFDAMQLMADMLRATSENVAALRRQVALLEKLTPAQVAKVNAAIRDRAARLCADYLIPGGDRAVAAMIRKDIRLKFGASAVRDVPRCEYDTVRQLIDMWDDYKALKALKGRL